MATELKTLVLHERDAHRERSTCGWRDRLTSREDSDVATWVHAVDIDGAREHYHKRGTELYYVLDGEGTVRQSRLGNGVAVYLHRDDSELETDHPAES